MQMDLDKRLFAFAINVLRYLRTVRPGIDNNVIRYQLTRSCTSAGANFEEAQGSHSKADFHCKLRIALKEMRESNYWLRLLQELNSGDDCTRLELLKESDELKKVLGAIVSKIGKQMEGNR